MLLHPQTQLQKFIFTALFVGAVIVGTFALYTRQATPLPSDRHTEPQRTTLSGTAVCLPHRDTTGPQTMECAFGLQTEAGEYYAVDFSLMSQSPVDFPTGKRFRASGVVTPVEQLSTNHWKQYPVEGIFSITDSLTEL